MGALLLLPALGLLGGGGVLLWADQGERSDDGYLYTASDAFATQGHALLSDRIDLDPGADWVGLSAALGTARVRGDGRRSGRGPLRGHRAGGRRRRPTWTACERTVVDDLGLDTSAADQVLLAGGAPSGPPADQDFWTVEATGTGTQQLDWDPDDGSWTLVVMNADGSAGVAVDARIGATIPALTGLAWGLLGGGLFLLLLAVLLLVLGLRRPAAGAALRRCAASGRDPSVLDAARPRRPQHGGRRAPGQDHRHDPPGAAERLTRGPAAPGPGRRRPGPGAAGRVVRRGP